MSNSPHQPSNPRQPYDNQPPQDYGQQSYGNQPPQQTYGQQQYVLAEAPKTKRKKWPIVVGVLALLTILFVGGCLALVGGAVNSVDKAVTESQEKNAPREVTEGDAFTVGSHETLAGWEVNKETALSEKGEFSVVGKVKNSSDTTSTAFIHFKFLTVTGEVLGNVSCNSSDLEPGQTQALNCILDGEWGKYNKITVEATF